MISFKLLLLSLVSSTHQYYELRHSIGLQAGSNT